MAYFIVTGIAMDAAHRGRAIGIFVFLGIGGGNKLPTAMGTIDVARKQRPAKGVPGDGARFAVFGGASLDHFLRTGKGYLVNDL